ncbi:restriction endonuclease subunit S [Marinilactibacillus psychrotolerans]|uniref:Restriction endonuclease subunit S n=1 Tax=Marinilactibacillus psychrotolerans TaxID=191770 RepID=A0A5R9C0S0_9LACT|nr:restriction endonuclease subunit S [Marinilactibacillus psychrotolerans]TLQ06282.1 restriction endonuclease subunit S [Marinilactibacillus psychrotolerans]
MSLSKENKYPEIRFKGFTETWEQRKFFDNIETTIDFRGRTPKKLGLDWSEKGYLALSALNVKNGFIDPKADAHYGNQTLYNKWMGGRELRKGQVLFTTEAPMGNVAQVPDDQGYILSQRTIAFEVKCDKMTNNFLSILLRSPKAFNELTSLSSGGTAKGVSQKSLSHFNVIVPTDLEEQQKIGLLFKKLDNAIALHQGKLDKLKNLKKAYLQVLFPSKEEDTPKMRFTNFNESWEQRELGEIAQLTMGQSPNGKNYTNNQNDYILVQGNADMKNGKVVPRVWTTQVTKTAMPNDIILSVRAPAGDVGKTDYSVVLGRGVAGIKGNEFIYQTLLRLKRVGFWAKYTTGSTFESINSKDLKKALIYIPSENEQFQIGEFLKKIDNTIALHQEKLDKLFILKKAYLKMMFI